MLTLDGERFACGRATFVDSSPYHPEPTAKIYVKVRFGDIKEIYLAQIDTGAAWSILAPDVAQAAQVPMDTGDPLKLSTRFGVMEGRLVKVSFKFSAEEGEPYATEGTFFVSSELPNGMNFIGYSGLLDSMRFALDPQANHFYFGP